MNRTPPGPRGLLTMLRLARRAGADPLGGLLELARTYGDLVMLRVGPSRFCLVNHPDLVREVLVLQNKGFRKPERFKRTLAKVVGNGLLTNEGDSWLRQRRLMQPAFHVRRMGHYAEIMVEKTRRLMADWATANAINIADAMTHLTLTIIAQALFDVDVASQAPHLRDAVRVISSTLVREARQPFALPDWLPLSSKIRKHRALRLVDQLIWDIIGQRRATGEDRGDLLSMLLLAVDEEGDGGGMTDQQARDEALTLFLAGHDSTAAGLTWTWYLTARHPALEARLIEEIDTTLAGRPPTWDDLPRLTYTEAVIKESLRLYPPNWGTFPRQAVTDIELGGYVLPKGCQVLVSPYVLHHDPRSFPDPERFDPERFSLGRAESIPQFAYIPFGAGPRVCIGNTFAMVTMKLVMATVLQQYRLGLAPGQGEAEVEPLLVLRPKGGLRMTVSKRVALATVGVSSSS
ncbi:MAG: cytochrome P450 [Pirellulales bacterium]